MTRLIKFLLALSLLPLSIAWGQNTTITATVVDSDGTVWANAPYTLSFRVNPSQPNQNVYNIGGVLLNPALLQYSGYTNGSGVLSQAVYQNTAVSPSGSQWTLQICPLSSASACGAANFSASGSTMNVSTAINAAITAPRFPALAGAYGYADSEAQITLPTGATYWNVTLQVQRYWNSSTWVSTGLPAGVSCTGSGTSQICTFSGTVAASEVTLTGPLNGPSVNSVANAALFSGADIGAKINAACASGGTVIIPAGTYNFSTPVIDSNACDIWGQGKAATILHYTGTTGSAVTLSGSADSSVAGYGLHNLHLQGPGSAATGVTIASNGVLLENVQIGDSSDANGFSLGLTFGTYGFLDRIVNSQIWHNVQNVYFPGSLTQAGENISFIHTTISNGQTFANCAVFGTALSQGPEIHFVDSSFDTCQLVNNDSQVFVEGGHIEDGSSALASPFVVTMSDNYDGASGEIGQTFIDNVLIYNNSTMTSNGVLEVDRYGMLKISNLSNFASNIPLVYLNTGSGGNPILKIDSPDLDRTAAKLYSVATSTYPIMNINTLSVHESASQTTDVWSFNLPGTSNWLQNSAIARVNGPDLEFAQWSGVGAGWTTFRLEPTANEEGMNFCRYGTFNISPTTGLSALGSDTPTCDAGVSYGIWNGLGYAINGNTILSSTLTGATGSGVKLETTNITAGTAVAGDLLKMSSDGTMVDAGGINSPGTGQLNVTTSLNAPTPSPGDNTTEVATTAFVASAVATGNVATATNVTGTVAIANGGTGATTAAGANLSITGVTQTGTLRTSSQVSTFPGTVAAGATTPTTIGSNGVLLNGVPALQAQTSLNNYYSGGSGNLTGTGSGNSANGNTALYSNTTGNYNTANGLQALYYNTTGSDNAANGQAALYSSTTGSGNTTNGYASLESNTTGNYNTANGMYAGKYIVDGVTANQTSSNSVYEGYQAYPLANGDTNENVIGNAAIGHGSNTTTLGNTATVGTWLNGTQHITATAPTASAGTIAAYSTNAGGEITGLSAATTVTITFANSGWTNAAFCVANSSVAATQPYVTAHSITAVTFTFPSLTGNLFYHCDGN